jgi:hypothetical protein
MTLQPPALSALRAVPAGSAPFLRAVPGPRSGSGGRGVKRGAREPLDPQGSQLVGTGSVQKETVEARPNKRSFGVDEPTRVRNG